MRIARSQTAHVGPGSRLSTEEVIGARRDRRTNYDFLHDLWSTPESRILTVWHLYTKSPVEILGIVIVCAENCSNLRDLLLRNLDEGKRKVFRSNILHQL